jgi:hypothetical protein
MRTPDGLILSAEGIADILGDDFPHATSEAVSTMLAQRRNARGCVEIQ